MKAKVGKYLVALATAGFIAAGLYYLNLSNRHKALAKTTLLHKLGLVDNHWHVSYRDSATVFVTPRFVVDNLYTSMEGPKAMKAFQPNSSKSELLWFQSFKTTGLPASRWQFLYASEAQVKKQAEQYLTSFKQTEAGSDFYHSSYATLLLDKKQRIRGFYNSLIEEDRQRLKRDVARLLD